MIDFESLGSLNFEESVELVCFFLVMLSLIKFLTTVKMLIMMMSLEVGSVFLFTLLVLISLAGGGGVEVGLYSVFLVLMVCEGVLVLVSMVNIFRKGSVMIKSLYVLKF